MDDVAGRYRFTCAPVSHLQVKWEDKTPKAMFRGADTNHYRGDIAALNKKRAFRDFLDVLCSDWTNDECVCRWLLSNCVKVLLQVIVAVAPRSKHFVAMEHHGRWRYLLHFPGRR